MSEYHDELVATLQRIAAKAGDLEAPAQAFTEMKGRFLDYQPGKGMECSFPAEARYATPAKLMQGGFIAAAIDNVYGHFALMEMGVSCVTTTISTTFIRPIEVGSGDLAVQVRLREKNRRMLFMEAKVLNTDGRTSATSSTVMVVPKTKS